MSNNKTTFLKDALILFVITLIAGLSLGFVNELTKGPIEERKMQIKLQAYQTVYKTADSIKPDEDLNIKAEEFELSSIDKLYTGIKIDEINQAYDNKGNMIGYIIVTTTNNGYGGAIKLALGYSIDKTMMGMEVLSMNETADLGTKANDPEFKNQFENKQVEVFTIIKQATSSDDEIEAISGATVTTDAVVNAINGSLAFINEYGSMTGGL